MTTTAIIHSESTDNDPEAGAGCVHNTTETEPLDPPQPAEDRQPIQRAFWETPLLEPGTYSGIPDRFEQESDRIANRRELAEAQRYELQGRVASARSNGWTRNARQKYRRILETDRECQSEFTNLHTVMLSLRLSPRACGEWIPPLSLISELSEVVRNYVIPACRRAISYDFEYTVVLAGTDRWATPHAHLYLWIDRSVTLDDFTHIVEGYTERCEYAPNDGTGNAPRDAITVRSPDNRELATETEHPHNDRGHATAGAVYVANQIPNVVDPNDSTDAKLVHGAVCDAFESSAVWFSRGCWSYGDPEPVVGRRDNLSRERFPNSAKNQNSPESCSPESTPFHKSHNPLNTPLRRQL